MKPEQIVAMLFDHKVILDQVSKCTLHWMHVDTTTELNLDDVRKDYSLAYHTLIKLDAEVERLREKRHHQRIAFNQLQRAYNELLRLSRNHVYRATVSADG